MHWATYRAHLRRLGEWHKDLNTELTLPMTRQIASSWAKVFEADMFAAFQRKTDAAIQKMIDAVERSAPDGLKDRVRLQGEAALTEAQLTLQNAIVAVKTAMDSEQKEISRCLAPHIQSQLQETYLNAMEERGKGSVKRQRDYVCQCMEEKKSTMLNTGSDLLLGRLGEAVKAMGAALENTLEELAQKVACSLPVDPLLSSDLNLLRLRPISPFCGRIIKITLHRLKLVRTWSTAFLRSLTSSTCGVPPTALVKVTWRPLEPVVAPPAHTCFIIVNNHHQFPTLCSSCSSMIQFLMFVL